MTGDRFVERRVVDAPGEVDHAGAGFERRHRHVGEVRLDRGEDAIVDQRPDHRQQRGELRVGVEDLGVGTGRLGSDVDHRRALDRHSACPVERRVDVVGDAFAIRRLERQVDHAELIRAIIEDPPVVGELDGAHRMFECGSVLLPQREQDIGCDHEGTSVEWCQSVWCQSSAIAVRSPGSTGKSASKSLMVRPSTGCTRSGATSHDGDEHESALVLARVGHLQRRHVGDQVAVHEQIEIERARAPVDGALAFA